VNIQQELNSLKRKDPALLVFGAKTHRYKQTGIKPGDISLLEKKLHCSLPQEYKDLLLAVGAGAGPYYGLYNPGEIIKEYKSYREYTDEEYSAGKECPITQSAYFRIVQDLEAGIQEPWECYTYPADGCIPVCYQGCTFWTVIVTCGELKGTVLDVASYSGNEGWYLPARRPPGIVKAGIEPSKLPPINRPCGVFEWYRSWIERCISDLETNPSLKPWWKVW